MNTNKSPILSRNVCRFGPKLVDQSDSVDDLEDLSEPQKSPSRFNHHHDLIEINAETM